MVRDKNRDKNRVKNWDISVFDPDPEGVTDPRTKTGFYVFDPRDRQLYP